jgi:hypothetical protein
MKIFLSYRRQDTAGYALGLRRAILENSTNIDEVFLDSDSLMPGARWDEEIRTHASGCDVALVLIGDEWLVTRDGQRKIKEDNDPVHAELELVLGRDGIDIVPILVEGAKMPSRRDLPEKVRELCRWHSHEIHDASFDRDVNDLIELLAAIADKRGAPCTAGSHPQVRAAESAMSFPTRITSRFLQQEVRGMGRDHLLELVAELRRRGWSDDEIDEHALSHSPFQPPERLPARITVAWLAANIPFLGSSRIRELSAELVRRGWPPDEIRAHVFEHRQVDLSEEIPARIMPWWLDRNAPLMTIDEQNRLAEVMIDRGWPPADVRHHLPLATTVG